MGLLAEATPLKYASIHGGGALQFCAPELHDPDAFGTTSTRPTTACDIYAFACVAIEVNDTSYRNYIRKELINYKSSTQINCRSQA